MSDIIEEQDTLIAAQDSQLIIKEQIIRALGQGNEAKQELIERALLRSRGLYSKARYSLKQTTDILGSH
jgi:hypothetical protein